MAKELKIEIQRNAHNAPHNTYKTLTVKQIFIYDWRYFRRTYGVDVWPEKDFKEWWERNLNYKNQIIIEKMEPILYRKDKTKNHSSENTVWMPLQLIRTMDAMYDLMDKLKASQEKLNKYSQFTTFLDTKKGSL